MKLPADVSGSELAKVAVSPGFEIRRQKGSHLILKKGEKLLVIPQHKSLKKGTLLQILRVLEISKEELVKML
ncbi:MAG: type II toxin-antitoxin system HicA family toxin [Candidatus Micrarchaeota archaeon]